jgi:hypothetical protein
MRRRSFLRGLALLLISTVTFASDFSQNGPRRSGDATSNSTTITSIPFGERNGDEPYNASGVIPLGDSRFLFCDNNVNDALFELNLTADGQKKGALIRRPLQGIAAEAIDDLEAMTLAEEKGQRFIFVASSLYVKKAKDGQPQQVQPSGLLRVKVNSDDSLSAENLPGFRDWFIQHAPAIAASANLIPDQGGLNIEGLAWDHHHQALLFGLRTPVPTSKLMLIPVRVKKLDGPWTTGNLKMLPPISLSPDTVDEAQGIRSIEYAADRRAFLVIAGKAISGSNAPFALYQWKGGKRGRMRRLNVSFAAKMKPEGITAGTVAGKPVLLFADDAGGYQVVQSNTLPSPAKTARKRAKYGART